VSTPEAALVKAIVTGCGVGVALTPQPESARRHAHNKNTHWARAVNKRECTVKLSLLFLVRKFLCTFEPHAYAQAKATVRRRACSLGVVAMQSGLCHTDFPMQIRLAQALSRGSR
jgi:hypothetical protein